MRLVLGKARGTLLRSSAHPRAAAGVGLPSIEHSRSTVRSDADARGTMVQYYSPPPPGVRSFSSNSTAEATAYSESENDAVHLRAGSTTTRRSGGGPTGSLFSKHDKPPIGPGLIGATASIQRTFGPRASAEGLLATGGAELAAHASFDPDYGRAQAWIRHHAVGPARLSPVLIAGLIGALAEAAFPQAIVQAQTLTHQRPLIVGVTVTAAVEVVSVVEKKATAASTNQNRHEYDDVVVKGSDSDDKSSRNNNDDERKYGYHVTLKTLVTRVRDDAVIAHGYHELWVPDYLQM